jgi:hypothetical protein
MTLKIAFNSVRGGLNLNLHGTVLITAFSRLGKTIGEEVNLAASGAFLLTLSLAYPF